MFDDSDKEAFLSDMEEKIKKGSEKKKVDFGKAAEKALKEKDRGVYFV